MKLQVARHHIILDIAKAVNQILLTERCIFMRYVYRNVRIISIKAKFNVGILTINFGFWVVQNENKSRLRTKT